METTEIKVLEVYAVKYGKWAAKQDKPWRGQEVQIRSYNTEMFGQQYLSVEMKWEQAKTQIGWFHLGHIRENFQPYFPPGTTRTMLIYSTIFKNGETVEVKLFDPSLSEQQIAKYLKPR